MRNPSRPMSPHLTIWRWGPHMLVSILHRATGATMATVGVLGFAWWLAAAASGRKQYDYFLSWAHSWIGYLVAIGLTWVFFQHMFSGLRHLLLDTGAGYELRTNKNWALMTLVGSLAAALAVWAYIYSTRG